MTSFFEKFSNVSKVKLVEFANALKIGNDIATLWMPGTGRTKFVNDFAKIANTPKFRKEFQMENFKYIYIDMSLDDLYLRYYLEDQLGILSKVNGVGRQIMDISAQFPIIFFLDNINPNDYQKIKYILALRSFSIKQCTFVSLIDANDYYQSTNSIFNESEFKYQTLIMPYFNLEEHYDWFAINYNRKLSRSDNSEIYSITGGVPVLMRQYQILLTSGCKVTEIPNNKKFINSVEGYYQRLSKPAQQFLISSYFNERSYLTPQLRYLVNFNFFDEDGRINGNWYKALSIEQSIYKVSKLDGIYIYGETDLFELLSNREAQILKLILDSPSIVVSRDSVAKIMWGDAWIEQYSDWSIDQTISRVRKKLGKVGLPSSVIKTVKGRGFMLNENVKLNS
jgi:hypothetical protein